MTASPRPHTGDMAAPPHSLAILAVDPGRVSGVALFSQPAGETRLRFLAHGTVTTQAQHGDWARFARDLVGLRGTPSRSRDWSKLIVISEKWTAGGWGSADTLLGMGAAWGTWLAAFDAAGIPRRRISRVYSQTWRAAVLGGKHDRDGWKLAAQRFALMAFDSRADADAAEAICIGAYAVRARELAAVLPRKGKR